MFVTFEGTEGGGKSTALLSVAEELRVTGYEVLTTREPGAGSVGKQIREILLHGEELPHRTELLLFLADRSHHVETIIKPALREGTIVLCDRYIDSTLVYQAFVRGLEEKFVRSANAFATDELRPDLTILFDLPVEIGLSRLTSRDRLDAQPLEFHQAVRQGFHRLVKEEPSRFAVIDATQEPAKAAGDALTAILGRVDQVAS